MTRLLRSRCAVMLLAVLLALTVASRPGSVSAAPPPPPPPPGGGNGNNPNPGGGNYQSVTVQLNGSWNIVGGDPLASVPASTDTWVYNASISNYVRSNGGPQFPRGTGEWVNVPGPQSVRIPVGFCQYPVVVATEPGWNLVGNPCDSAVTVGGRQGHVWMFNLLNNGYQYVHSGNDEIYLGYGAWVWASGNSITLFPGSPDVPSNPCAPGGAVVFFAYPPGQPQPPCGHASVWTDRNSYPDGNLITICYTVPGPGFVSIDLYSPIYPNGVNVLSGNDDGSGGCLQGTTGTPYGQRHLHLSFNNGSAQADWYYTVQQLVYFSGP